MWICVNVKMWICRAQKQKYFCSCCIKSISAKKCKYKRLMLQMQKKSSHCKPLSEFWWEISQVFPLKWEKLDHASMLQRYFRCNQIYIFFCAQIYTCPSLKYIGIKSIQSCMYNALKSLSCDHLLNKFEQLTFQCSWEYFQNFVSVEIWGKKCCWVRIKRG